MLLPEFPLKGVVQRIADAREVAGSLQHQGFHVRPQGVVDRGKHRIGAFAGILEHEVAGIVDEVGIVAEAADHRIGAGAAIEQVVAAVPEQRVRRSIAEALQVGSALQHQGLHIRRQRVVDRGEDCVSALAGALDHGIDAIVDEIGIVAGPADHDVGAGSAVEQIVAGIAEQRVGQSVAEALQVGSALQHQGLDVRRQLQMGSRKDDIVAFIGVLDHRIAATVDDVEVVASAAEVGVVAGAANERVIAVAAEEGVDVVAAENGVVADAAIEDEDCIAGRQACSREGVVAGAALDDEDIGRFRGADAHQGSQAGDRQRAVLAQYADHVVADAAVDDRLVNLIVACGPADRAGEFDVTTSVTSVPLKSLTVMLSVPPSALTSMLSTSLRSMTILPRLRVNRARPPLAKTWKISAPALPLKSRVSLPS